MPVRSDLKRILVLGAGPIVIGQGLRSTIPGTQGVPCAEGGGLRGPPSNSNPATIADRSRARGSDLRGAARRPRRARHRREERPDADPADPRRTDGAEPGARPRRRRYAETGIGAPRRPRESIRKAEDRALFKAAMEDRPRVPKAYVARSVDDDAQDRGGARYPLILRRSFTLGGTGGGIVRSESELEAKDQLRAPRVALTLTCS